MRNALKENEISYTLVYPDISLKEEYIQRYKSRGNNEKFISFIADNWESFIKDMENEKFPILVKLESNEYLSDVFNELNYTPMYKQKVDFSIVGWSEYIGSNEKYAGVCRICNNYISTVSNHVGTHDKFTRICFSCANKIYELWNKTFHNDEERKEVIK